MRYLERVIRCIANTTRYPDSVLTADADLEFDLGIDSVKRLEITIALGDEFSIPVEKQTREAWVRTVGDVATWVQQQVEDSSTKPAPLASQPPTIQSVDLRIDDSHSVSPPREVPALPSTMQPQQSQSGWDTPANLDSRLPHERRTVQPSNTVAVTVSGHEGKIALVTGGGRGVGKVISRRLAASGATVLVNSFHSRSDAEDTVREIQRSGGKAVSLWGSVANPNHVDQLFEQIDDRFGRLDYLVCNASDGKIGSFLDLTPDDWDRAFRTNVSGHYRCAVLASQLMQRQGGGAIVTLSAVGSDRYIRGLGSQGVVKASVETMTRYLACELGPLGIRVNCVSGGPVYGDLLDRFPDATATQQHWESMTPSGELSNAIDLANAILYLLGPSARGVNGAIWSVDQGFSAVADGRSERQRPRNAFAMTT